MLRRRKGDDNLKVITAMGENFLNNELNKFPEYEVIGKDIIYREGILEILEVKNNINLIILSNKIPGECTFEALIEKLINYKNIEIIVFLKEKNENIEKYLNSKKIFKIYFLNNNGYNLFLENLYSKKELEYEIKSLKKLIISKQKNMKKIKLINIKGLKLYKPKKVNRNIKTCIHKMYTNCRTVVITGANGSGKTIISKILTDFIKKKNKKVFLLNIKNNKFNNYFFYNECELKKYIEKLKEKYEYLIIDLSLELKKIKTILYSGDKIIFLVEPNLLEIEKSKNILDIYINDFEINVDKIKILFNKSNKYKIAESILEELFEEYEIIGEIKYDEKYNLIINKNKIENYSEKEYEKIYKSI